MLRRSVKIQLILFVIITLIGVSYVSAEYVGLTKSIFGNNGCTVHADFPESGGIFTNAEVTYRGVTVGKVGALHLRGRGVRVDLDLDDCSSNRIPASASATVADRSVVGEQYVDLKPPNGNGPYVANGTVIPMSRNHVPTATEKLLTNLNSLIESVPLGDLKTTVDELGKALNGRGDQLGSLLDSTNALLTAAQADLPDTIALIDNSKTVLGTQLAEQSSLKTWTHSLNLISQQLKKSDPDIRRLLDSGPTDLETVRSFINNNKTDIGVTLANLSTVGNLLVRHIDGIEEILELYPALAAGGPTTLRADKPGEGHPGSPGHTVGALGLVLKTPTKLGTNPDLGNDPPDCGDPKKDRQGYNGPRRLPSQLGPVTTNVTARCTAPVSSGTDVRGSANVPGGDPISASGGNQVYPRAVTDNTVRYGGSLQDTNLGDAGWLALLTDGLH